MTGQRERSIDLDQLKVPFVVGCGTVTPDPRFLGAHRRLAEHTGGELFTVEGADHFAHTNHPDAWASFARRTIALGHESADPTVTA
jgi:pimeloyl-ACP methyl ester carboxylesterase